MSQTENMSTWEEEVKKSLERAFEAPVFLKPPVEGMSAEEAEKHDRDRLAQAMIEGSTEYDWDELPEWLQKVIRNAADEFCNWADAEPIKGEIITIQKEVEL